MKVHWRSSMPRSVIWPATRAALWTAHAKAHASGAALVVAPELALTGYPPEDLLLRPAFMQACARELATLATALAALRRPAPGGRPSAPV
jgi:predicted amidohydrolase